MADLTFLETRDRVLYMLYCLGRSTGEIVIGPDEDYEAIIFAVPGVNRFWSEKAFDALVEAKLVENETDSFGMKSRSAIGISLAGIEQVEAGLGISHSETASLRASYELEEEIVTREVRGLYGDPREQRVLKLSLRPRRDVDPDTESNSIPAADRTVTLDHNQPAIAQGLEQLDQLIEEVRASNECSGQPEEKEQAVVELSAARKLLEATRVRVRQLVELTKPALAWVVENFTKESIKELAKAVGIWLAKNLLS